MRRLAAVAVLTFVVAACGGGDGGDTSAFVSWATENDLLGEPAARCVADRLSADERDALVTITPTTPDDEIDADAVEALEAAEEECGAGAGEAETFDSVGDSLGDD